VGASLISHIKSGKKWKHIIPEQNLSKKDLRRKLTENDIPIIRGMLKKGSSRTEIARLFNVSSATIDNISKNKSWSHIK
jgi:DNA invertase Pin-like site-specific DNA recombinase